MRSIESIQVGKIIKGEDKLGVRSIGDWRAELLGAIFEHM